MTINLKIEIIKILFIEFSISSDKQEKGEENAEIGNSDIPTDDK
jgi:hypothetical protein